MSIPNFNSFPTSFTGYGKMITVDNELAKHITEARESRGWSQRELGRRAEVSGAAISKLESGMTEPTNNTLVRIALALDEDPQNLLRLAGHLPAVPPPTDHDAAVLAAYRGLSTEHQKAVAVLLDLAEGGAEHAPTAPSQSGRAPTEEQGLDAHALWEEVVFEMEYCGRLLLEGWTDRAEGDRHFLSLQQTLLRLFWTLMGQEDQAWAGDYTQRLLNAYRRHQEQHEGERHETPISTDRV